MEKASDAELCSSESCLFAKLGVNSAATGDILDVKKTKKLKRVFFMFEPFINNHRIQELLVLGPAAGGNFLKCATFMSFISCF